MAPARRVRRALLVPVVALVGLVPSLTACDPRVEAAGEKAFVMAANTRCKMQWQQIRMAREGLEVARRLGLTKSLEDRYSALRQAALAGVKGVPVPSGVEDVYSAFTGGAAEVVQQLQDGEISADAARSRMIELQQQMDAKGLHDCAHVPDWLK